MPTRSTSSQFRLLLLAAGAVALLVGLAIWALRGDPEVQRPATAEPAKAEIDRAVIEPGKGTAARDAVARTQVSGEVRSSSGEVIADAVVTLVGLDDEAGPQTTRTDASGVWSFADLVPGRYALSATATGYLASVRPSLELRGEGTRGLVLQLDPGGTRLSGTVADKTGGVIEGALVRVTPQAGISRMRERESYFTLTDEHGRYALQVPSGRVQVRASHSDYTDESVVLEVAASELVRDFALVPTAVLEGVVVRESDGAPVPEAEVSWARERSLTLPDGGRINTVERGGRVIADASGRFRISALPPGLVVLSARASMLASTDPLQVPVGIAERVTGIELRLSPASDIDGRVIAAGDGAGIADAQVELMAQAGPGGAGAQTDADGRFRIHGVLPGSYRVLAMADGWRAPAGMPPMISVGGEPSSVVVELERGLSIRGRVEPAVAAEVAIELRPESMQMGGGVIDLGGARATQSAADTGSFELGPVAPGHYTLEARVADGRGGTVEVDVGPNGADEVVIRLEQRATLTGHVEDFTGKRIADVSVRARKRTAGRSLSVVVNGQELAALSSPTSTTGTFELAGLAAGPWTIEVVDAQGDPLSLDIGPQLELELRAAEQRELILRVEPRDGTITGIVRDAEGEPVADAWVSAAFVPKPIQREPEGDPGEGPRTEMHMVMITDEGSSTMRTLPPTLTDERGRFAFTGLRRGEYTLTAEFEGGASKATLEHVTPDADVKLELAPLGAIEGTVVSDGRPANCVAQLSGPTPRTVRVRDGRFEVERIEPGRYTVEARAPDGSKSAVVEVEAGGTATVDLMLERLAKITGKIVDESGAPLEGVEILVGAGEAGRIEISREDTDPQIFTAADGTFEVHAAAGGRVLLAQQPGIPMPIVIKPFVVTSGQDLDLGELRKKEPKGMVMMEGPEPEAPTPPTE